MSCAHRSSTWEAFKAHRRACPGHQKQGPQMPAALDAPAPDLTGDDLDHLASLYDQLREEGGV